MTHAGFWVDGAVRKPEKRHLDSGGCVAVNWKDKNPDFDICSEWFEGWDSVYWLDTTPRESLTPEELLSIAKLIWPDITIIYKHEDAWYSDCQGKESSSHVKIDWGDLTQYPPPVEPQWIRVTRENVGQYLFRDCRTQKNDITYAGRIVGWCIEDDCCLVESDYQTEEPILQWDHVEVQNAFAS